MSTSPSWGYTLTAMEIQQVPESLGFSSGYEEMLSSRVKRKEVVEMKQNRAKDLTLSQAKGILMTFISSFFIGRNLSLFTIVIYGYQLYNSFSSIINVNKTFKMYESPELSLFWYKLLYVMATSASFGLLIYKIYGMGLIPLNAADWSGLLDIKLPERKLLTFN